MKKMKLLAVIFVSFMIAFGATGCSEQPEDDTEKTSAETEKILEEYHATCKKNNKYSLRMSDEFVTCLYEKDNEHFDRLYDIQLEMSKCIKEFIIKASDLRGVKEYGSVISSSFIQENEKPTYDNGNNKIIFPMNYKIYSTQSEVYDICVKMEVNMNNDELPKMEKLNKDYKFAIECFYNENGERVYTCSPDGENIYAGTLENYEENSSVYALEMPDPDPIESQPDGDYDYTWYDEDSRVVSDNTTDTVDPEANLPADLKADLAMLRAMGYKPTGSGYNWECGLGKWGYIKYNYGSYGTSYWSGQVNAIYRNSHGTEMNRINWMKSKDLVNFYDDFSRPTKHFMFTKNGMNNVDY